MKILDISDSLKIIQKHKKAEKSEVISDGTDRPTDIVNYRVALTRVKRERERHCKENKSPFPLVGERVEVEGGKRSNWVSFPRVLRPYPNLGKTPAISHIFPTSRERFELFFPETC